MNEKKFTAELKAMSKNENPKKRVVTSLEKLTPELLEALKARYPYGFTDHMIRIDKPTGEFFYAVTLETEDTIYLVKVNVKIDTKTEEELEKDIFADDDGDDDEIKGAEEIADTDDGDD